MKNHDWIIEVCEDLKRYAKDHNLGHLTDQMDTALTVAKHEISLVRVDAIHNAARECESLGTTIGIRNHQGRTRRELQKHVSNRCQ